MKEFIENLLPLERNLFFALNGSDSIFLDNLFWTVTGKLIWVPILLFLTVMFFYRTHFKIAILTVVTVAILFALCDQISSSFFKETFQRMRPTYHPDFMNMIDTVKGYRSSGYSFISGHATNSFGFAVLLSLIYKNRWITLPLITWATINSYSRIYLGVHFTSDVVAGIIIGTLIALVVYQLYKYTLNRLLKLSVENMGESPYTAHNARLTGIIISSYIIFIVIFSPLLAALHH